MERNNRHEMERVLEERLKEPLDNVSEADANEKARDRISPPYEYRIRAERDPIAEETKIIRSMAKEPDEKYDKYAES